MSAEEQKSIKPLALVDVDNVLGIVGPNFGKWLREKNIPYEQAFTRYREELKRLVRKNLDPRALEKLRELSSYADIILFSEMPHELVRPVREVLKELGINLLAIGKKSELNITRKKDFIWLLPVEKRPVVWFDDPYARENFRPILEEYPHVHLVIIGAGQRYKSFQEVNVRKEIEEAIKRLKVKER